MSHPITGISKKNVASGILVFCSYVYLSKTPPNKTHFNVFPEIVL